MILSQMLLLSLSSACATSITELDAQFVLGEALIEVDQGGNCHVHSDRRFLGISIFLCSQLPTPTFLIVTMSFFGPIPPLEPNTKTLPSTLPFSFAPFIPLVNNKVTPEVLDGHDSEPPEDASLKQHIAANSQYFSGIPEDDRIKWVRDNLGDEFAEHEKKRRQFEEEGLKWAKEQAELETKKAVTLRKEVIRIWMRKEEESWKAEKTKWAYDKRALEKSIDTELEDLRTRGDSSLTMSALWTLPKSTGQLNDIGPPLPGPAKPVKAPKVKIPSPPQEPFGKFTFGTGTASTLSSSLSQ
ncbi:hypothetical protein GALMADRAFT_241861 [Galerina marginata CBS 339.88]|uniref:Clathrin light chain n=1 Tax=Galerina marginata (strain CBS 339.88) TaxID=685588 RepID=A0A067TIN5_GALM3|nr:hypothetical protein GALMADRAFT_241861 [Galerina marginata CBS 339.88]